MTVFHNTGNGVYKRCQAGRKGGRARGCPYGGHTEKLPKNAVVHRSDRGLIEPKSTWVLRKEPPFGQNSRKYRKPLPEVPAPKQYSVTGDYLNPDAYDCPEDLREALRDTLKHSRTVDPLLELPKDSEAGKRVLMLLEEQAGIANILSTPLGSENSAISKLAAEGRFTQEDVETFLESDSRAGYAGVWRDVHPSRRLNYYFEESRESLIKSLEGIRNNRMYREASESYPVKEVLDASQYDCPHELKPVLEKVLESGKSGDYRMPGGTTREQAARVQKILVEQAGLRRLLGQPVSLSEHEERKLSVRYERYRVTREEFLEYLRENLTLNAPRGMESYVSDSRVLKTALDKYGKYGLEEEFRNAESRVRREKPEEYMRRVEAQREQE